MIPYMKKKYKKLDPSKPVIAKKGLVIAYIGDGKGKTSAAMGLAARAAGAGMNVFILQFVKARRPKEGEKMESGEWPISNEIIFFEHSSSHGPIGRIETDQVGLGFVGILGDKKERDVHVREALRGLEMARQIMLSGKYDVVIFDELLSALELNLIEERDVLELISLKPEMVHMVMTGHEKFSRIVKACDLVTEMKMVKHPYYKNIIAQRGIDF